jgi:asparagine synthase (glutamine-hydrolysing)
MCGIAGIVRTRTGAPVDVEALARMTGALVHRGPDDEGLFVSPAGDCGLGARRLSIIDLAGGHQPLTSSSCPRHGSASGACWVMQNGEIYNYKPLRAELEARGHVFHTHSDTEAIAHAYEEWGEACVERLWGMFALAVWDHGRRRLLLARDRLGKKPLFFAQVDGHLLFASEIKALLRHPDLHPTLDARSLEDVFTAGFVPGPATIWQEIRRLPPAHAMLASTAGELRTWRYWDAPYPPAGEEQAVDPREAVVAVRELLADAVRLRLQSDVPVGALLSGGLDSTGLVALMQQLSGGRAHTFSIGFSDASHDESAYARLAAAHLGTEHHVLPFDRTDFDHLPQVVASLDQPQCFATAVPIWLLYKACRAAGFKVILTGEGSDELFAGYPWFRGNRQADPLMRLPRAVRAPLVDPALPLPFEMSASARRVLRSDAATPVARYAGWLEVSTPSQRGELFTADFQARLAASDRPALRPRWQAQFEQAIDPLAPLHRDLTLERHLRLPDFINHEVDLMSMAHSVEARVPYLDHRLWELVAQWPPALKLDLRKPEKWLLRQVSRPDLPEPILRRRKQGLATPHAAWWRQPAMPDWAEAALAPDALAASNLFSAPAVARWRSQHRAGQGDWSALLTGVLNTQLWLTAVQDVP